MPPAADLLDLAARIEQGEVKALSILQPWPYRIFHEGKDVENRDWATRGRGWFLIHAGKSTRELDTSDAQEMALPRGAILGAARIVDCVTKMDSRWFVGRYGFVLRDAIEIAPVPCRGELGFFRPADDVLTAVTVSVRHIAQNHK